MKLLATELKPGMVTTTCMLRGMDIAVVVDTDWLNGKASPVQIPAGREGNALSTSVGFIIVLDKHGARSMWVSYGEWEYEVLS